jgi:molecular chaperone DnaK
MTAAVLGIDLGTTYSVAARIGDDGRAEVLRNPSGAETMPSVVCFDASGSVLVGDSAKTAAIALPDRTVALVKRRMGTDSQFEFDGEPHTPESISALILRGLVESVLAPGTGPVRAVVTVPAYFGLREREATAQACALAGIELLELVAEPVAASIHYGLETAPDAVGSHTVLVYDLGGGTFDATVLEIGTTSRVLATGGDTELGGADWDRRLVEHLLERYRELAPPDVDPGDDDAFMAELLLAAEAAKRRLTVTDRQRIPMRYGGAGGWSPTIEVTRSTLEELTHDLLERTFTRIRQVLQDAGKETSAIEHVLLVGGSSRMPSVAAGLAQAFGWRPRLLDPDFAVAKGAALRAARLTPAAGRPVAPRGAIAAQRPVDDTPAVVPRSVGVLLHDSYDPAGERLFVWHVVHRNEELPVEREAVVATITDRQLAVRIQVYEQAGEVESEILEDNRRVLDGELRGIPDVPAGSPVRIVLALGLGGRLTVTATESTSGASLQLEAYIENVPDGAVALRQAATLAGLKVRR